VLTCLQGPFGDRELKPDESCALAQCHRMSLPLLSMKPPMTSRGVLHPVAARHSQI